MYKLRLGLKNTERNVYFGQGEPTKFPVGDPNYMQSLCIMYKTYKDSRQHGIHIHVSILLPSDLKLGRI
jgi:hypothetical protein